MMYRNDLRAVSVQGPARYIKYFYVTCNILTLRYIYCRNCKGRIQIFGYHLFILFNLIIYLCIYLFFFFKLIREN